MNNQRGSVFFYILLGVVLFAALSFMLMSSMRSGGDSGSIEQAKLQAHAVVEYASKAKLTVQDMKLSGIDVAQLSFLKLGDAGYSTAPHTKKVFHPEGGGLPVPNFHEALNDRYEDDLNIEDNVYVQRIVVEDVGTGAEEVVVAVVPLKKSVCEQINRSLHGSTTIPDLGSYQVTDFFDPTSMDPMSGSISTGTCPTCVGHTSYCVYVEADSYYLFYSVLDPN